ncbi:MAG TPA: PAS-domain containing protein [Rhizomicrobium sp.]
MHSIPQFIADLFSPLAYLSQRVAEALAGIGHHAPSWETSLTAAFLVSALVIGLACSIWAAFAHTRFIFHRQTMRGELARSRAVLLLRDAIIEGSGEAIVVMGVDMSVPLTFGGGSSLLQDCLSGPDAAGLAMSLDRLLETGIAFDLTARIASSGTAAVRGYPIGRRAVLFLRRTEIASGKTDPRAALDRLPQPVWLRGSDLGLIWVNRAFLALTGAKSVEDAVVSDLVLHKSERDLAQTVREFGGPVEARRYAVAGDKRCAFTFTLDALPDGNIIGTALDVTDAAQAEARLKLQADANAEMLDRLEIGVAMFGADRRLSHFNAAYVKLWDLPEEWLATRPSAGEVLDRLRELRKLPEQRDFAGWKLDRLAQFDGSGKADEEYWHLPSGQSLRVSAQPDLMGGLTLLYEDVSAQLRLESSYTNLIRVQRATLDTLEDGMAVFGTDGRLKLHNSAFADLWKFAKTELSGEPHLKQLSVSSALRFEHDNTWNIISSAVSSADPGSYSKWGTIARSDGRTLSLALTRLPDGATLVSFSDETSFTRLDELLHARAAA